MGAVGAPSSDQLPPPAPPQQQPIPRQLRPLRPLVRWRPLRPLVRWRPLRPLVRWRRRREPRAPMLQRPIAMNPAADDNEAAHPPREGSRERRYRDPPPSRRPSRYVPASPTSRAPSRAPVQACRHRRWRPVRWRRVRWQRCCPRTPRPLPIWVPREAWDPQPFR